MKKNLFTRKSLTAMLGLALVVNLLLVAVTPALAMPDAGPGGGGTSSVSDAQAEAMFHHAITVYTATLRGKLYENNSLDTVMLYVTDRQNKAIKAAGKGYGTFSNADYVGLFGNLLRVGTLMDKIKILINDHPGFDKYGQVVNSLVASATAQDIDSMATSLETYASRAEALLNQLNHSK